MKIIEVFSNPRLFKMLLSMNYNGYLKEIGWVESFKMKMPVDKDLKKCTTILYTENNCLGGYRYGGSTNSSIHLQPPMAY
jgi:hypothetical protein